MKLELEMPDDIQLANLQFHTFFMTWTAYVVPLNNSTLSGFIGGHTSATAVTPQEAIDFAVRDYREKEHNLAVGHGITHELRRPENVLDMFE